MYSLIRNLAERHRISLIAFYWPEQELENVKIFERFCEDVVVVPYPKHFGNKRRAQLLSLFCRRSFQHFAFYSDEMQHAIASCTASQSFDIIQVEHAQMGFYALPGGSHSILDQHNVEYELFYRVFRSQLPSFSKVFHYMEWRKFQKEELEICRRFSLCLTTSERDKAVLQSDTPSLNCQVIPNGVDSRYFVSSDEDEEEDSIVFTGTINYRPNLDGMLYFLCSIYPLIRAERESVKFYIVGKDPPAKLQSYASSPGIVITGKVADVRPYLSRARVVVAPLRIGGGTRLKILEALAMGKALVATSIAAEGLDLVSEEHLVIADDPRAFARRVLDLLADQESRVRLGANGRKLVEENYDWRSIAGRLEAVHRSLAAKSSLRSEPDSVRH